MHDPEAYVRGKNIFIRIPISTLPSRKLLKEVVRLLNVKDKGGMNAIEHMLNDAIEAAEEE